MFSVVLPIRDERGRFLKRKRVELPFDLDKVLNVLDQQKNKAGTISAEHRALKALRKFGFERAAAGYYKVAFIHNDWVIKTRKNQRYNTIPRELKLLRRIKGRGKIRYIPDTFYVRGYMVQRRYDTDYNKYWDQQDEVHKVARKLGIEDVHTHNVGWDGDRFVFIDFDTRSSKDLGSV